MRAYTSVHAHVQMYTHPRMYIYKCERPLYKCEYTNVNARRAGQSKAGAAGCGRGASGAGQQRARGADAGQAGGRGADAAGANAGWMQRHEPMQTAGICARCGRCPTERNAVRTRPARAAALPRNAVRTLPAAPALLCPALPSTAPPALRYAIISLR